MTDNQYDPTDIMNVKEGDVIDDCVSVNYKVLFLLGQEVYFIGGKGTAVYSDSKHSLKGRGYKIHIPEPPKKEKYICQNCGEIRLKSDGGTIIPVCNECGVRHYSSPPPKKKYVEVEVEGDYLQDKLIIKVLGSVLQPTKVYVPKDAIKEF